MTKEKDRWERITMINSSFCDKKHSNLSWSQGEKKIDYQISEKARTHATGVRVRNGPEIEENRPRIRELNGLWTI